MKYLLLVFVLTGCTSTSYVSRETPTSHREVMDIAGKRMVTIRHQDGRRIKGKRLRIDADSVHWRDLEKNEIRALPLSEVDYVVVPSKSRVSLALLGAAVLGAIFTRVPPPECYTDSCTVEALSYGYAKIAKNVGFGLLGALGYSIGQAVEPNEKFVFVQDEEESMQSDDLNR